MILTTHALTGALIGKNITSPWIVIGSSLIVHYAMDMIRHAEYFDDRIATVKKDSWKVMLDLAVAALVIYSFILTSKPDMQTIENILLGSFFSVLPDGITLLYWLSGKKYFQEIKAFHDWMHRYDKIPKYAPERQWSLKNARNDIIISIIIVILLFI